MPTLTEAPELEAMLRDGLAVPLENDPGRFATLRPGDVVVVTAGWARGIAGQFVDWGQGPHGLILVAVRWGDPGRGRTAMVEAIHVRKAAR